MKLSVLMPAYNAAPYIAQAITSVLAQTHANFELFVINDGSTDETLNIANSLAAQDQRIHVISHENCGMGEALNRALTQVQTEWVVRMDADDLMLPERLERQIQFLEKNPRLKVASCLAQYIDENSRVMGQTANELPDETRFQWYISTGEAIGLLHPGVIMHRDTIMETGGYRKQFWPADDIDLWNRVAEKGHLILIQNEVLMQYRVHSASAITSKFFTSRIQYEWVRACMKARRQNLIEPTWESFKQEWDLAPWFIRFNRRRKIQAKALYHEAGHACLRGDYLIGVPKLLLASIFQPAYVFPRLREQVFK